MSCKVRKVFRRFSYWNHYFLLLSRKWCVQVMKPTLRFAIFWLLNSFNFPYHGRSDWEDFDLPKMQFWHLQFSPMFTFPFFYGFLHLKTSWIKCSGCLQYHWCQVQCFSCCVLRLVRLIRLELLQDVEHMILLYNYSTEDIGLPFVVHKFIQLCSHWNVGFDMKGN